MSGCFETFLQPTWGGRVEPPGGFENGKVMVVVFIAPLAYEVSQVKDPGLSSVNFLLLQVSSRCKHQQGELKFIALMTCICCFLLLHALQRKGDLVL